LKSKTPPDIKVLELKLDCIIQRVGRYSGMPVSVGVSSVYENSRNFANMVKEAMHALGYRSAMGGQKVFPCIDSITPPSKHFVDDRMIKELGYLLHFHSIDYCLERIEKIRDVFNESENSIYYVATSVFNVLIKACDDLNSLYSRYDSLDNLYRKLFMIKTDDEIFDYLKKMVSIVRNLNDEVIVDSMERNLRKVVLYMEKNFCDPNISFESLAKDVNFSVSYISTLLKKKLNTSYVKMLTELRIEKAKQLLADPALKIMDIAEQLGYKDSYYFSHCFKKYVGISPKEFRNNEQSV
jgi:two-component system response regulator YesN